VRVVRRPGDGVEGAQPNFSRWAAQQTGKKGGEGKERVFHNFEKRIQSKFKLKFELNKQK
jgi:hypothetical protein